MTQIKTAASSRLLPLLCALALTASPAFAADAARNFDPVVPTAAVGETDGAPVHYRLPLSKFTPEPGPLVLRDASTAREIAIPFSTRLRLKTMAVNLTFTSSIAL